MSVSVSLLIPPLLSHSHLSLLATPSVCLKNCPCNALSVQSCLRHFALLLLNPFAVSDISSGVLAVVISFSSLSWMYFCSPSIAVLVVSSILIRPLPPSFLDRYILSTLLFGCKALWSKISSCGHVVNSTFRNTESNFYLLLNPLLDNR